MIVQSGRLSVNVYLFIMHQEKVLLLRRNDDIYTVVTDQVNEQEQLKSAAIRIAREKVGIVLSPESIDIIGLMQRDDDYQQRDFYLATTAWLGNITNIGSHGFDEVAWFGLAHLPPNILPHVRYALDDYKRGVYFNSFEDRSFRKL